MLDRQLATELVALDGFIHHLETFGWKLRSSGNLFYIKPGDPDLDAIVKILCSRFDRLAHELFERENN